MITKLLSLTIKRSFQLNWPFKIDKVGKSIVINYFNKNDFNSSNYSEASTCDC